MIKNVNQNNKYPGYFIDDDGSIHNNVEQLKIDKDIYCQFPPRLYNHTYECHNRATHILDREIPICDECLKIIDNNYNCRDEYGIYHVWENFPDLSTLDEEFKDCHKSIFCLRNCPL